MRRRQFIGLASAACACAWAKSACGRAEGVVPPRNRRPYSDVDWDKCFEIRTTSHVHCFSQQMLDNCLAAGYDLLTISNYYPSAPCFPARKMTRGYYAVHHDFPVMVNGVRREGPIDWNRTIAPWAEEIDGECKKLYPLAERGPMFQRIPEGILEAPNAEHHRFIGSPCHMCSLGSMHATGTFDRGDKFRTRSRGGFHPGVGEPWQTALRRMFDALIVPDGGGVTINHPSWSSLKDSHVRELLDFDPRVLGIEVLNAPGLHNTVKKDAPWTHATDEDYWDRTLATGRQCFGFFVPDWGARRDVPLGMNILLVRERTVAACLQAYRKGDFYGALKGQGALKFRSIRFDGRKFTVALDKKAHVQVLSAQGVVESLNTMSLEFSVPPEKCQAHVYLRARAYALDGSGEVIYTQPQMLV